MRSSNMLRSGCRFLAWALLLALTVVTAGNFAAAWTDQPPPSDRFEFAIIGDLGYPPETEPLFANVLADLNMSPLDFVAHVGDLGNPAFESCTDDFQGRRLTQFQASAHPLIYTPGDNDWTDCWEDRAGNLDPFERLARVRAMFFLDENSLGQRQIPLIRQSRDPAYAKFRENARWNYGGITFLTIHYVDEVLGRTLEGDAEFAERNAANLAWLRQGFREARSGAGIVIMQQGNPFPERPTDLEAPAEPRRAFRELINALEEETLAFGSPVLFVHGDTHYFRVDKPLFRSAPGCRIGFMPPILGCQIVNFTRLEGFGNPTHHWVQVSVDASDPGVFTIRPRLVPANMVD